MALSCVHISNKYRVSEMATRNPNPYSTSHRAIQMYQRPCITGMSRIASNEIRVSFT
jgi:hypothetical protein